MNSLEEPAALRRREKLVAESIRDDTAVLELDHSGSIRFIDSVSDNYYVESC